MPVNYREEYQRKLTTPEEAVKCIQSGDMIIVPLGFGQPPALLQALMTLKGKVNNLNLFHGLGLYPLEAYKVSKDDFLLVDSGYIGGPERPGVHEGRHTFSPFRLGDAPRILKLIRPPQVTMHVVSPMDEHGFFSCGTNPDYALPAARLARNILVEVNQHMPRTLGDTMIHISEVTAIVENHRPLPEVPLAPPTKEDELIAQYIVEHVPDGATMQFGIGGLPGAVGRHLKDKKDLGIHSEMLTDIIVELYEAGAVTCKKKTYKPNRIVGTFAVGTKKLYNFMHDNPMVEMLTCDVVNDPYIIAQNDNLISINGAMQIDLTGQVNSESLGPLQYTGTGGQVDFVRGAWLSKGGKSFLTLYSTAKNGTVSRIVPKLDLGSTVTTLRTDVMYVVTEYGAALLKGQNLRERAKRLIAIAHPDYRDWLTFEAKAMNLI